MSAARFTPGPWVVGWGDGLTGPTTSAITPFCGGRDWKFVPISKGEETIALVPQQDILTGDYMETARVMSAAPELYEALTDMVALFRAICLIRGWEWDDYAECNKARAALSKATGSAEGTTGGEGEKAQPWVRLMDSDWVNIVNHPEVLGHGNDADLAVACAVRLTEARLRELNASAAKEDQQ